MLTPEYLDRIAEGAEDIAEELHQDIINRIVERITIRLGRGDDYILTPVDKWQLEVLQEAGYLAADLQKEIAKRTKLQAKEIKEAFEDAGVKSVDYDDEVYESAGISTQPLEQSPHLVRLMQRGYDKTLGEWSNFTGTLANAAQALFISECDKAYNLVTSGALSYSQAVREAVERIAADGVTVTYPSGHTDTIETATLRAVRTGVAQATADITLARMEEMGWDIILVSSHLGARVTDKQDFTNHAWWQGKFYSRTGTDKRFPPFEVCGYGHVQGIDGANCRHSFSPSDGIHNPFETYDSEENQKAYELSQRQRTLERRIRKTKRETMTLKTSLDNAPNEAVRAEIKASYQRKAALLQKQNKAYNEFCKANNLKRRADRVAIAKWDRKQAAAARGAARKREKALEQIEKERTIISEIRETGALPKNAQIHLEPTAIDVTALSFDDNHINKERAHNVTSDDAVKWIRNAHISATVWNGRFERYYSFGGATYVDKELRKIRTAYSAEEYDEATKKLMEVLKKHGI